MAAASGSKHRGTTSKSLRAAVVHTESIHIQHSSIFVEHTASSSSSSFLLFF